MRRGDGQVEAVLRLRRCTVLWYPRARARVGLLEDVDTPSGSRDLSWTSLSPRRRVVVGAPLPRPLRASDMSPHRYMCRPEADFYRYLAFATLGDALRHSDPEAALTVKQAQITMLKRFWPNRKTSMLILQGNMSNCYDALNRHEEALDLRRSVYAGGVALAKEQNKEQNVVDGNNLSLSLMKCGLYDEAKQFARKHYRTARRLRGDEHIDTITAADRLADALYREGQGTRADMIEAEKVSAVAASAEIKLFRVDDIAE